ncbi:MAG: hypothetical protein EOP49_20010 [Sphingobacteriales bacterium]|nr:MAG: hypothetical protein EOP49_20010 [Sphingobacteriales bacterium]
MTRQQLRNGAFALLLSAGVYTAQAQTDARVIAVPDDMPQEQQMTWKKKLPTDGWFMLRFKDRGDRTFNYTNKDYELCLWLNCSGGGEPGFHVEYSDNYRDGDFGGIDYISSGNDNGNRAEFAVDGKKFGDPFAKGNPQMAAFKAALKSGKTLTLSVYDTEMDPETGKGVEKLNRAIDFKLAFNELLEKPVNCGG